MSTDIRNMPFEDILEKYGYLIERHAHDHLRSCAPVMDVDDFRQELRIVLWRAHQNFLKPAKMKAGDVKTTLEFWFIGYVNQAMSNRAHKRAQQLTGVQKRIPPRQMMSWGELPCDPGADDTYGMTDLSGWTGGLSPIAQRVMELTLLGYSRRELGRASGFTSRQVKKGLEELRHRAELLGLGYLGLGY